MQHISKIANIYLKLVLSLVLFSVVGVALMANQSVGESKNAAKLQLELAKLQKDNQAIGLAVSEQTSVKNLTNDNQDYVAIEKPIYLANNSSVALK